MSDDLEWRVVYGRKQTAFSNGRAIGDFYEAPGGAFRVRCWPPYRLQGGAEVLVLSEEAAREALVEMLAKKRAEEGEG